jgi:hypothetical protein
MAELSMHELEAQTGEVLPEREALSAAFVFGSRNHVTQVNAFNQANSLSTGFISSAHSSANQVVITNG